MPAPELVWSPITSDGGGPGPATGALRFKGAYLAFGADSEEVPWVSRSIDGRHWQTVPLGVLVEPCPGYVARSDSTIYEAATDGRTVVLAGIEFAMDGSPCDSQEAVMWVSADGQTWQRSQGFGAVDGFALSRQVWAVPGGWEAVVETAADARTTLWRSSDALRWHQVGEVNPSVDPEIHAAIGAAPDGRLLRALFNGEPDASAPVIDGLRPGESSLSMSTDGARWTSVDLALPVGREVTTFGVVPPGPAGPAGWTLVTSAEPESPMIWTSSDLQTWSHGTFPRDRLLSIAFTRYGFIATGSTRCPAGSGPCATGEAQYLSTDGLHWTRFKSSVREIVVADGPAGVLAFSAVGFRLWELRS